MPGQNQKCSPATVLLHRRCWLTVWALLFTAFLLPVAFRRAAGGSRGDLTACLRRNTVGKPMPHVEFGNLSRFLAATLSVSGGGDSGGGRRPCADFHGFVCANAANTTGFADVNYGIAARVHRAIAAAFDDERLGDASKTFAFAQKFVQKCAANAPSMEPRDRGAKFLDDLRRFSALADVEFALLSPSGDGGRQDAEKIAANATHFGKVLGGLAATARAELFSFFELDVHSGASAHVWLALGRPRICEVEKPFDKIDDKILSVLRAHYDAQQFSRVQSDFEWFAREFHAISCAAPTENLEFGVNALLANRLYPTIDFRAFLAAYANAMGARTFAKLKSDKFMFYVSHTQMCKLRELALATRGRFENFLVFNLALMSRERTSDYFDYVQNANASRNTTCLKAHCLARLDPLLADYALVASTAPTRRAKMRADLTLTVEHVTAGFRSLLAGVAWLSAGSRARALSKLANVSVHLLNAPHIESAEAFDAHFADFLSAAAAHADEAWHIEEEMRAFRYRKYMMKALSEGKQEFEFTAKDTNAFYHSRLNALAIPLGYVQEPYYIEDAPYAWLFGALGSVIGHELAHAFDVECVKRNESGDAEAWMDAKSASNFARETECVARQYGNFCEGRTCVNGSLTLADTLSDIAGFHAAYRGLENLLATVPANNRTKSPLDGISLKQLHSISYALVSHPPGRFRVLGTLQNNVVFRDAFRCTTGEKYAPAETCAVWSAPRAQTTLNNISRHELKFF